MRFSRQGRSKRRNEEAGDADCPASVAGRAAPKDIEYSGVAAPACANGAATTTASEVEKLFAEHGSVESAEVINDRMTGRSKGFGFVQMQSDSEAEAAITALNGQEFSGRTLTVNEAKPRTERSGGGGGRGGYGGGGGGGGRRDRY